MGGITSAQQQRFQFHNNRPTSQPKKVVQSLQLRGSQLTSSGKFRRSPLPTSSSSRTHHGGHAEKYESKTAQELALEAKQQLISLRGTSKASVLQENFERKRKERVIQAAKSCLEEPNKCQTFATLTSVL